MFRSTQQQSGAQLRTDTGNPSSRSTSRRGAALVEFALTWTIFFLVTVVGVMDFGRGIWAYNLLAHASQEATRYAMVRGSDSLSPATQLDIESFVEARTFFLGTDGVTVTTTWTPDNGPGGVVEVQVQHTFSPLLATFLGQTISLSSTAQTVIAQSAGSLTLHRQDRVRRAFRSMSHGIWWQQALSLDPETCS